MTKLKKRRNIQNHISDRTDCLMRAVNFRFDDMKHIDKIYKMSRTSLEMVIQLFLAIKEDLNQHGLNTS